MSGNNTVIDKIKIKFKSIGKRRELSLPKGVNFFTIINTRTDKIKHLKS